MLDALCRRAPEVASARRVTERYMVLLVVGNNEEIYSLVVGGMVAILLVLHLQ